MNPIPAGRAHFVDLNGLGLHVRADDRGEGPSFVYVNSLGSDLRIWDGVVSHLEGYHLRHDLRGHGLSDAPVGPYSIEELAGDLQRLLELAGLDRVVLVGISVGGLVALRFALEWPEKLRALIVCDSAARIGSEESWGERIATVEREGLESIAEGVVDRWFSPGFGQCDPATLSGYRNMLRRTTAAGYAATCAALRDEDLRGRVGEIATPSLVLCGSEDKSTPPAQCRELAAMLKDGRYREIAAAGHLPCVERPTETAGAIEDFLAEVAGGS